MKRKDKNYFCLKQGKGLNDLCGDPTEITAIQDNREFVQR